MGCVTSKVSDQDPAWAAASHIFYSERARDFEDDTPKWYGRLLPSQGASEVTCCTVVCMKRQILGLLLCRQAYEDASERWQPEDKPKPSQGGALCFEAHISGLHLGRA